MRINALIQRICLQMIRDKRTLALLFVAPLLILSLMYVMFNGSGDAVKPKLGAVNVPAPVSQALAHADIEVIPYHDMDKETIVSDKLDGALISKDGHWSLLLENVDPTAAKAMQMKVGQIMAGLLLQNGQQGSMDLSQASSLPVEYVYGNADSTFFDVLSPILIGFFVFFFVFLISGIGLLRERTTGTLERLMSTPIRRGEVITGYLTGYGLFAVIQTVIVVLFAVNVLDISLVGSIWNVLVINLLLALVALSLGILLSTFASSEFQMVQFIPVVVVPQVFFSGIFALDGMAEWLQTIARIMPLYYAADALKGVMYKGYGFGDIIGDLLVLVLFVFVFIGLNVIALKKYRKPSASK
ncbi:ABC transporter permease [Cohnella endophytica]|uniref:ABC transporter permease n=1 Tax=Cohnella endophytica TaxID=2419778 RepID=A0A494Y5W4_9BACL|nr:ABC transporter permease [Cohnella endophytica]RKP58067.1 ABC transporter permease [Cohnella endophytica]